MEKKSQIKEDYDKTAEIYNERYGDIQLEKYSIMLQDLKLKKPILDLGCGTGMFGEFLKAKKGITGIDISLEMLKQSSGARVQGDIENLPFKSESFTTVVSFTALQNLEDAEKMLKEVKRVLKKDGTFVLTFLNKMMDKMPEVENHFDVVEMKTCGEDIGLVLRPLSADK
jgi:ubiquinone/menaquinone biosynthesis C-methylase UbiE